MLPEKTTRSFNQLDKKASIVGVAKHLQEIYLCVSSVLYRNKKASTQSSVLASRILQIKYFWLFTILIHQTVLSWMNLQND